MNSIGVINEREVYYFRITDKERWFDFLPFGNWLVMPLSDERNEILIDIVAQKCLEKKVVYICTTGKYGEYIHDVFDETIADSRFQIDSSDELEHDPVTTWDAEIVECLWFALYSAQGEHSKIEKIVCLDFASEQSNERTIVALMSRFSTGWVPD